MAFASGCTPASAFFMSTIVERRLLDERAKIALADHYRSPLSVLAESQCADVSGLDPPVNRADLNAKFGCDVLRAE